MATVCGHVHAPFFGSVDTAKFNNGMGYSLSVYMSIHIYRGNMKYQRKSRGEWRPAPWGGFRDPEKGFGKKISLPIVGRRIPLS